MAAVPATIPSSKGSPIVRLSSLNMVGSRCVLSSVNCCSVFRYSNFGFGGNVCDLKLWVLQKLKLRETKSLILKKKWKKFGVPTENQTLDKLHIVASSEGEPEVSVEGTKSISEGSVRYTSSYQHDDPEGLKSQDEVTSSILEKSSSSHADPGGRAVASLCISVIGATGELARNKVFPALFALYYSGFLPENVGIFGYSRKQLTDEDLRSIVAATLTCRVDHQANCGDRLDAFLRRTYHQFGEYDNKIGMAKLNSRMEQIEDNHEANRIFYLSVPQEALLDVALSLADKAQSRTGWNRIIIEKPFGFNALSSYQLTHSLLSKFEEKQIYRIDHLLGKDLIENLTVLRFSNLVFEPLWSRTYIRNVQVVLSEECGMETRGRYFGGYGVIRDVVHSHILQTIALFAMEPPVTLHEEDIRNEKVKVLRSIRKLDLDDVVLGQHKCSMVEKVGNCKDDLTPTFFAAAIYIDNPRWDGVPFFIKVGMGLIKHRVEIRIQFHHVPGNLYRERMGHNTDLTTNELILRDLPDEAILLKINNKVPGLGLQLDASELNLLYRDKYNVEVPDSYEHLLLDVIDGDNHLFMRSDEVAAAWNILNPIVRAIDEDKIVPELYQFGGRGPVGAYYLGAKHGVRWADE